MKVNPNGTPWSCLEFLGIVVTCSLVFKTKVDDGAISKNSLGKRKTVYSRNESP